MGLLARGARGVRAADPARIAHLPPHAARTRSRRRRRPRVARNRARPGADDELRAARLVDRPRGRARRDPARRPRGRGRPGAVGAVAAAGRRPARGRPRRRRGHLPRLARACVDRAPGRQGRIHRAAHADGLRCGPCRWARCSACRRAGCAPWRSARSCTTSGSCRCRTRFSRSPGRSTKPSTPWCRSIPSAATSSSPSWAASRHPCATSSAITTSGSTERATRGG